MKKTVVFKRIAAIVMAGALLMGILSYSQQVKPMPNVAAPMETVTDVHEHEDGTATDVYCSNCECCREIQYCCPCCGWKEEQRYDYKQRRVNGEWRRVLVSINERAQYCHGEELCRDEIIEECEPSEGEPGDSEPDESEPLE